MLQIYDCSPKEFLSLLKGKKLFIFGAGNVAAHFHDVFCRGYPVTAMIDNNKNLWGSSADLNSQKIPVLSPGDFARNFAPEEIKRSMLFITPAYHSMEIVRQLDVMEELNGLACCLGMALKNYPCKMPLLPPLCQTIERKIHWCWFGKSPVPPHLQAYIDGWKRLCPDYEIIRWDESNYDVSKSRYMREAYEAKKWGFVSDYARLDIVYREGGIYLDTDVELLRRPDELLHDKAFFAFNYNDVINIGTGFGAQKGHPLVRQMRDYYDNFSFKQKDGSYNTRTCYFYQHPVLKDWGFKIENSYQKVKEVAVWPSNVFVVEGQAQDECTVGFHHAELSWVTAGQKSSFKGFRRELEERLRMQAVRGGVKPYNTTLYKRNSRHSALRGAA